MTGIKKFNFLSRNCRTFNHVDCCGAWCGLGLHVICNCLCHDKKELELPFQGKSNSSRLPFSGENTTTDGR